MVIGRLPGSFEGCWKYPAAALLGKVAAKSNRSHLNYNKKDLNEALFRPPNVQDNVNRRPNPAMYTLLARIDIPPSHHPQRRHSSGIRARNHNDISNTTILVHRYKERNSTEI